MARRAALHISAVLPVLLACSAETVTPFKPQGDEARIRVVNASSDTVAVRVSATVISSALTYSRGTGCFTVNATESGLSVQFSAQTLDFGSAGGLDFLPGESANIFAMKDGTVIGLIRIPADTIATAGQARLQVLNATSAGPYDVHVTGSGGALGSPNAAGIATGGYSSSFQVPAGERQLRFTDAGTQNVVIDVGTREWTAGERQMLIVAPPAPGTSAARAFFFAEAGC